MPKNFFTDSKFLDADGTDSKSLITKFLLLKIKLENPVCVKGIRLPFAAKIIRLPS